MLKFLKQEKMKAKMRYIIGLALIVYGLSLVTNGSFAQNYASDPQFKVKIDFNRWHDVHELYDDMRKLEEAYPDFGGLDDGAAGRSGRCRGELRIRAGRGALQQRPVRAGRGGP